jgi:hypothetical protein
LWLVVLVPIYVVLPSYPACAAATHSVRPDSPDGSVPDVTNATTDPVGHVPWGPGRLIVTVTVVVPPAGRIAVIPVLTPAVVIHNTVPAGKVPSAAWSVTSIKDSTFRTAGRYWRWSWSRCWYYCWSRCWY